jgi:hypothetical protein
MLARSRCGLLGAICAAVCLTLAPAVAVAAPANDDFANRQPLAGPLPIEVTGSNVGATKEVGEYPVSTGAGRSVWFEWEAPQAGWVTIDSCGSDFKTRLGIFTGTEIGKLTQVVDGNASEGPGCMYSQRRYTFRAVAGMSYVIAVDGDGFFPPFGSPPVNEGQIALRIEPTPPPPNDLFANATALNGQISEEPGGNRVYFARSEGYNWHATTEPGEPIVGTAAGASVWYSWTPPESGRYRINPPCCSPGFGWAFYSGDSLASLAALPPPVGPAGIYAVGGSLYRIAVYGAPDLEGEPAVGGFGLTIFGELSPGPILQSSKDSSSSIRDRSAPETKISRKVVKRKPRALLFSFSSSEQGSSFRCSVNDKPFTPCGKSRTFSKPSPERRTLRVYAVDAAGNADPSPAATRFKISPPPRRG